MGLGRILCLENTLGSSVFVKAKTQTSSGSYGTFVTEHNLSVSRKLLTLNSVSSDSRSEDSHWKNLGWRFTLKVVSGSLVYLDFRLEIHLNGFRVEPHRFFALKRVSGISWVWKTLQGILHSKGENPKLRSGRTVLLYGNTV